MINPYSITSSDIVIVGVLVVFIIIAYLILQTQKVTHVVLDEKGYFVYSGNLKGAKKIVAKNPEYKLQKIDEEQSCT